MARIALRAGRRVVIANSRGPRSMQQIGGPLAGHDLIRRPSA
jgi:hypothetical protein